MNLFGTPKKDNALNTPAASAPPAGGVPLPPVVAAPGAAIPQGGSEAVAKGRVQVKPYRTPEPSGPTHQEQVEAVLAALGQPVVDRYEAANQNRVDEARGKVRTCVLRLDPLTAMESALDKHIRSNWMDFSPWEAGAFRHAQKAVLPDQTEETKTRIQAILGALRKEGHSTGEVPDALREMRGNDIKARLAWVDSEIGWASRSAAYSDDASTRRSEREDCSRRSSVVRLATQTLAILDPEPENVPVQAPLEVPIQGLDLSELAASEEALEPGEVPALLEAPEPRKGGIDFNKLRERHQHEMEHGPALDAAWAAGRRDGRIPTFPLEDRQALLTGDTFPVKDAIKGLCGKWRPEQKGWVVPAFGENYCDRRNFDYVQRFQESLEALANRGITITYQTP